MVRSDHKKSFKKSDPIFWVPVSLNKPFWGPKKNTTVLKLMSKTWILYPLFRVLGELAFNAASLVTYSDEKLSDIWQNMTTLEMSKFSCEELPFSVIKVVFLGFCEILPVMDKWLYTAHSENTWQNKISIQAWRKTIAALSTGSR